MKIFKFIPVIMILCCWSCQTQNEPASTNLKGTKWKLTGIVDAQTGDLKVLEPIDCERCYTFLFDTDTTAWGYTVGNDVYIRGLNPLIIGGSKMLECGDPELCYAALRSAKSYMFSENEFKLFFNNNNNYLLYKSINQ